MIRKHSLYTGAQLGWTLFVGATFVLLYSGQAEPLVSPSDLPRPLWMSGAIAGAAIVLGLAAVRYHERKAWLAMGRTAELTPEDSSSGLLGLLRTPDLSGVVDGRPVRVRTESRTVHEGDEEGRSSSVESTIIEAELDEPAADGVIIGRTDSGEPPDRTDLGRMWLPNQPIDDRFVAIGGSPDLAEAVLTPRVREALSAVDTLDTLLVGNAVESVKGDVAAMAEEESWGNLDVDAFEEVLHDDPATVGNQMDVVLHGADELERQLEAVVTTAAAFEDVRGHAVETPTREANQQ